MLKKITLRFYKKSLFYILIFILYVLTLGLGLKIIDKEISLKYEVDEVYFLAKSKTDDEQKIKISTLDKKGRKIRFQISCLVMASIITFSFATGLLIKKGKVLSD